MFVALSRNVHSEAPTLLAPCLAPGPREFVTAAPSFPAECRHVLQRVNLFAHLLAITTHATAAKPRHLPLCCHGTARRRKIPPPSTTIRPIRSVFPHSLGAHRRGAPRLPRIRFCRLDRGPRRFFRLTHAGRSYTAAHFLASTPPPLCARTARPDTMRMGRQKVLSPKRNQKRSG